MDDRVLEGTSSRNAGSNPMTLLSAVGIGATLMYVLDPDRGRQRRKLMRDQLVHARHKTGDTLGTMGRDLKNRTYGKVAAVRGTLKRKTRDDPQPDIRQRAQNATDDQSSRRKNRSFDMMQENWSPATRLLSSTAGASLLFYGARRHGALGTLCGLAGAALATRGLTNMPIKRLTGVSAGRRAVDLQKTITINAPVEQVFPFFTAWENWPRWMSHVREVRAIGEANGQPRTHWTVDGPLGATLEWDATVTKLAPNERLAWKTVDGAAVQHAGILRFQPTSDGATIVDVKMSYNPPAGVTGHAIATLLGRNPRRQLNDDLARLKTFIETGKPPHDAAASDKVRSENPREHTAHRDIAQPESFPPAPPP